MNELLEELVAYFKNSQPGENDVNAVMLAERLGVALETARTYLKAKVKEGKLEEIKFRNRIYYRKKQAE